MAYYTLPTNAVNPQATRLFDESSGAIQAGEGTVNLPYDFSNTQWAPHSNFYTNVDSTNSYLDYSKMQALADMLQQGGYQVMQAGDSVGNGSYSWVQDAQGNIVAEPQYVSNDDDKFRLGMLAAMGFAGGSAAGLASPSAGGIASAAPTAGGSTPLNMAAIESGLGTAGYGTNAAASASGLFDAATIGKGAGLMYGPGSEIIAYNPQLVGSGGISQLPSEAISSISQGSAPLTPSTPLEPLPSINSSVPSLTSGSTTPLNMAAIESGLGTPGYGYNAAAAASGLFDPAKIGAGAGLMYGVDSSVIPYNPNLVGVNPPSVPSTPTGTPAGPPAPPPGGGSLVDTITDALPGTVPDWLKLLIPALGGLAAYKDAQKPQLQGYGGSIGNKTATRTTTQGKYGPISNVTYAAAGGMMPSQTGIASQAGPRYLNNAHDGMADGIAAHIDGKQPAALSGGEFVIPADVVAHFGNGNSNAGAKQLYAMMDRIRQARTGTAQQGKEIDPQQFMPR